MIINAETLIKIKGIFGNKNSNRGIPISSNRKLYILKRSKLSKEKKNTGWLLK